MRPTEHVEILTVKEVSDIVWRRNGTEDVKRLAASHEKLRELLRKLREKYEIREV